jgi:cytochrome c556
MVRVRLASLAVCLLALGVASCGGGDAPSKAEFRKKVEKICTDTQNRLRDVGKGATTAGEIADAVDKVIKESRDSVNQLKDLELPSGSAHKTAQNFVDATAAVEDKGIPALERLRDALRNKDQAAARKATQELQSIKSSAADKYARELGATDCVG